MNRGGWTALSLLLLVATADAASRWEQHRDGVAKSVYGTAAVPDVLAALSRTHGGPEVQLIFQAMALRKAEMLTAVKDRLRAGTTLEKFLLTKLLRYCPWPETQPELLSLACDKTQHWLARQGALYALGALGDRAAGPHLERIVREDGCPQGVLLFAISALARLKHREAVETIRAFSRHEDVHLRLFAVRALAEFGEPVDLPGLTALLAHEDYVVRQEACEALAFTPQAEAQLRLLAQRDPHEAVRETAARVLLEHQLRDQPPAAKAALLHRSLPAASRHTATWIVRALLEQGGKEGRALAEQLAERDDLIGERARYFLILATAR